MNQQTNKKTEPNSEVFMTIVDIITSEDLINLIPELIAHKSTLGIEIHKVKPKRDSRNFNTVDVHCKFVGHTEIVEILSKYNHLNNKENG